MPLIFLHCAELNLFLIIPTHEKLFNRPVDLGHPAFRTNNSKSTSLIPDQNVSLSPNAISRTVAT